MAEATWDEYRSFTWAAGTVLTDLNSVRREGLRLGYDRCWLYPVLPQTGVDSATTAVQSYASSLTLAGTRSSGRSRTTSTKPETSTTVEYPSLQLNQVATVSSGIPRIHAAQPLFRSLVEQDLRLAITDGLDELVRRGVSTVGTAAAVTGDILRKIRRGMTVVQSNGYNPNVPAIDPAGAESFDWLQSSAAEKFYVYGPGQGALRLFGVQMRVWKTRGPRCSTPMHSAACTSRQWSCAASRLMAG